MDILFEMPELKDDILKEYSNKRKLREFKSLWGNNKLINRKRELFVNKSIECHLKDELDSEASNLEKMLFKLNMKSLVKY